MIDDLSRKLDRTRWPLRIAYMAILLLATLTNLEPVLDPAAAAERAEGAMDVELTPKDVIDAVRNVVLFAGWGLVWMATAAPGRAARSLGLAVGSGVAISVAVETAQLFSDRRNASALDVLYNGGGALIGAVLLIVAVRQLARQRDARSYVGIPAALFAAAYAAAALGEALIPLFRQDRLAVWGDPLSRFVFAIRAFEPASVTVLPLSEVVLFLPAGFFLTAAFVEAGYPYHRSAWMAAGAGAVLLPFVELVRGAASMAIPAGPIIVHVLSVAAGAAAAAALLPLVARHLRGAERPQLLFAVYAGIITLWYSRPYMPELSPSAWLAELSGHWWMPMAFASARMDLFSVLDVTNAFFLFLPVGGLLAVWPFRRRGRWNGIMPGILLAVAVETVQLFIAGRTLALADMLIGAAGVWIGWVIVRRAGFPVRGEMLPQESRPAF